MSNLDWLRTLSAEELKDWFYHTWLDKMAKSVTHSENYLVAWLNSTREEHS